MSNKLKLGRGLKVLPKMNPNPGRWLGKDCKPVDAMDPDRMADHLPSMKETWKEAEYVSQIADSAQRSGAGVGTTKGARPFMLKPSGEKAYSDFHDRFTREKEKKEEKKVNPLRDFIGKPYSGPQFQTIALPETFCVICTKKDIQPGEGVINISPVAEPWPGFGIIPGDCFRYAWCRPCNEKIKSIDKDCAGLKIWSRGEMVPLALVKMVERCRVIDTNVEKFLRAARLAQTPGVFPDGR